jgi:hypothetical protein
MATFAKPVFQQTQAKRVKSMIRKIQCSMLMGIALSVLAVPTHAGLISYTAGGVNLVYDDDRDLTWVADANLFKTQSDDDAGTAQAIIDDIGTIDDGLGTHTLVLGDFNTGNGRMTWWGAMAWAEWLGNEGYGGANDWGLWSALNSDGSGPCNNFDTTGNGCNDSDLGHLNYIEGELTTGQPITASTVLNNHFTNLQFFVYWSDTEFAPIPNSGWGFRTGRGEQGGFDKVNQLYGWAVRSGQVASAPLPATGLLMALGLVGLCVARSRRRATLVLRSFGSFQG